MRELLHRIHDTLLNHPKWMLAAALLVVGLSGWPLSGWAWSQLEQAGIAPVWSFLGCALACNVVYRVINAHGWWLTLRAMDTEVSPNRSAAIWLTSESLRWLPGIVAGYGSRTVLAQRLGVSLSVAGISVTLELVLTVVACPSLAFVKICFNSDFLNTDFADSLYD